MGNFSVFRAGARCVLVLVVLAGQPAPGFSQAIDYNRDIRPILAENCFVCHGHDSGTREADLRLDQRDAAIDMGAIVPGEASSSELIERIFSTDADWVMPPPDSRKRLTGAQRRLLRDWINQGATYEVHWSYAPIRRPEIPPGTPDVTLRNPIDAFIAAGLARQGLAQQHEADRTTLLRRVYLDLIGLPPSPQAVRRFVLDDSPQAYERVVDELLASPQFGERMATMWLDVVRYADTVGYHGDQNQNAFPYRDWVIGALNDNMPFDQFTLEQIAGDLLPDPTQSTLTATCFNRLNMMTREGGAQPDEYLAKYAADRVRAVGAAWLGSTTGCAECHDHKYDPYTMVDFYSMAAFFADLRQWGVYQDYEYTPNPDLRNWSNDHPFPPEIEVDVPFLAARRHRLVTARDGLCRTVLEAADENSLREWRDRIAQFLDREDGGWRWMTPEVVAGDEQATGTARAPRAGSGGQVAEPLEQPAWLSVDLDQPTRLQLVCDGASNPYPAPINAVRIDFDADARFDGWRFAAKTSRANLRVEFHRLAADGATRHPIALEHADAEGKLARYYNGFEILGIHGGWSLPNRQQRQVSVWWLREPLVLAADEKLLVTVAGIPASTIAVAVTPLAPSFIGGDSEGGFDGELLAWFRETPAGLALGNPDDPALAASVGRQWLFSGVASATAERNEVRQFEREVLECRGGRWPVMISQSQAPRATRVLPRGNWQDLSGEVVQPELPEFLPQQSVRSADRLTRLDLAQWLVAEENPLTARVQVNRYWHHFFGVGLSGVLDDFGIQGQYPTHPELLDWLASEFRDSGWNVKGLVRAIVTSATYRQASQPSPLARERDPGNRWLSHQNVRRLEAEAIRDNALALAGLINLDMGGPPAFPYQPDGYYAHLQFPDRRYTPHRDDRQYRRGVYMHWQRTFLHPMLANFDAPSREECVGQRLPANTPLQALTLLNDPTFVEAARGLATRVLQEADGDERRIEQMFEWAVCRAPTADERASLLRFVEQQRAHWRAHPAEASQLIQVGLARLTAPVSTDELAAWTSLARAVLNLHETITRY